MVSRVTTQDFVEKASKKHGYRYDYTEALYVKSSLPVRIRCAEHGVFEQMPRNHLRGSGCPICAAESRVEKGEQVGTIKKKQAEQSKFFPEGTVLKLPFWGPVPE